MISVALLAWLNDAAAHPFGARFAAHRIELAVTPDRVGVTYLVDVPNGLLDTRMRTAEGPVAAMAAEVRSGLVLVVDGQTIQLVPSGGPEARPTADTVQIRWDLAADLDAPPREVSLSNGNLPDATAVFSGRVLVDPHLSATSCSLWNVADGALARDDTDRWRTDERARALTVSLQAPAGPLTPSWLWLIGEQEPLRNAADTRLPSVADGLVAWTPTPGGTGLALVAAPALGAWVGRRRWWLAAALGALLAVAVAVPRAIPALALLAAAGASARAATAPAAPPAPRPPG